MVAVAADHAQDRLVVALGHLGRVGQAPAGVALLVDHQADLVAQVQLVPRGHAGDEADRVEAHRLGVHQVAAEPVGVVRQFQPDRAAVARVRAAEVDPPPVEPESSRSRSGNRGSRSGPTARRPMRNPPRAARTVTRYRNGSFSSHSRGCSSCSCVSHERVAGGQFALERPDGQRSRRWRPGRDGQLELARDGLGGRRCRTVA